MATVLEVAMGLVGLAYLCRVVSQSIQSHRLGDFQLGIPGSLSDQLQYSCQRTLGETMTFEPGWLPEMFTGYRTEDISPVKQSPSTQTWTEGNRTITIHRFVDEHRARCEATWFGEHRDSVCGLLPQHDGPHVPVARVWSEGGRLVCELSIRTKREEPCLL